MDSNEIDWDLDDIIQMMDDEDIYTDVCEGFIDIADIKNKKDKFKYKNTKHAKEDGK